MVSVTFVSLARAGGLGPPPNDVDLEGLESAQDEARLVLERGPGREGDRFDRRRPTATALAEELLEQHGVVLVPGAAFGDDRYLRLSFAASTQELEQGLERLSDAWR